MPLREESPEPGVAGQAAATAKSDLELGIEALIRWNHPTLGMLGPAHFIGVAEEAGLIMGIWEWVLVAALIQHNAWLAQGLPAVSIAVNLSSVQFSDPALAERVEEIARVVGVPLDYLELEVTESMLLVDFDVALKTLTELRQWNVAHQRAGAIKYGQALLDISDEMNVETDAARYRADREKDLRLSATNGIDAAMKKYQLDALLFPGPSSAAIAAKPGYPTARSLRSSRRSRRSATRSPSRRARGTAPSRWP